MHKKILFLSKSDHGPSTRYRARQFFPLLEAAGWHTQHIKASSNPIKWLKILSHAAKADAVVVIRKTFSWPYLKSLRLVSKRLIYDFDDAIFTRNEGIASPFREKRFKTMTRICDYAWAGNSYLAQHASINCANTLLIPTSLDPQKYLISVPKSENDFDLVWIGSSSTKRYLMEALPILEELGKQLPNLRLKVIADFDLPTQYLKTIAIPWSGETEAHELASAHIGIAPMYDDAWTRGKCALKVIQYMAAGLPVVSSPVGVNKDIVLHEATGFLANDSAQWLSAIQQLRQNKELRIRMGEAGRQRVIDHYSISATFAKMRTVLEK